MKTIIVTTDFSDAATNAVDYAAGMAAVIDADLLLLNVVQIPVSYSELPVLTGLEDIMRTAEKDMQDLKTALKLRIQNVNLDTEVGMGVFFEELKGVCERIKPYAVVMGTQGKTASEHLLFGEHAVHTAKNLQWPVITVPPLAGFRAVKKITLASDFQGVIENKAIEEITMLLTDFNAELHILYVGKKEDFDADHVFEWGQMPDRIWALKPTFHFIDNESVEEGIMDFAAVNQMDLVIVLPKHHGFIDDLFVKSHTKQLVLHSPVPVMAIHR